MKTLITLVSLIIFCQINAQAYTPMVLPDNNWTATFFMHGLEDDVYIDNQFRLTGEEVVFDGKVYKEIEYRYRTRINSGTPPWGGNWEVTNFYLRESTAEKKVWIYYDDLPSPAFQHVPGEFLLYDFNLEVGDDIPIDGFLSYPHGIPAKITEISYEYIDIPDVNWQVKTFTLSVSGESQVPFVLYEGIGSSHGLVMYELSWDAGWELIGFNEVLSLSEQDLTTVKIYPNPFKNQLVIDSEERFEYADLYDTAGRHILKIDSSGVVNTSELTEGIYFLKIKFKDSSPKSYKLIKR